MVIHGGIDRLTREARCDVGDTGPEACVHLDLQSPLLCSPCSSALQSLCLIPLLDPLIQRLQHARIHRRDHIHRRVQFLFRHPRFPCVRKAPINSGIAKPHHRHGQSHEHLFPFAETLHRVGVAIKGSKVGFLQSRRSFRAGIALPTHQPLRRSSSRSCSTLPGTLTGRRLTNHRPGLAISSPNKPFAFQTVNASIIGSGAPRRLLQRYDLSDGLVSIDHKYGFTALHVIEIARKVIFQFGDSGFLHMA